MTTPAIVTAQAPAWMARASRYLGIAETPGAASTPAIMGWRDHLRGWWRSWFTDDAQPWCALFVNACLAEAGISGTGTMRASDFTTWGEEVDPQYGAVLVFSRPMGAHVGFYVAESAEAYLVRGGNQGDAVSDAWIAKRRRMASRWPTGVTRPVNGRRVILGPSARLSTNEQ